MYSRNSKDPRTDPGSTPQVVLETLDAKPLIDIIWWRSAKYDSNHLSVNPRIP